jgi:putative membrane protein
LDRLLGRPPTGADVLLEFHQFDLFEQISAGTADQRGDAALRKLSESESDAAENRDALLMKLSNEADLNVKFTEEPSLIESDRLAGLQGSVGEAFVRKYYQDQVAEHESTISLLQRYIAKPDNEDVKTFAMKLIPALRTGLATVRTALANSNATAKRIASDH